MIFNTVLTSGTGSCRRAVISNQSTRHHHKFREANNNKLVIFSSSPGEQPQFKVGVLKVFGYLFLSKRFLTLSCVVQAKGELTRRRLEATPANNTKMNCRLCCSSASELRSLRIGELCGGEMCGDFFGVCVVSFSPA